MQKLRKKIAYSLVELLVVSLITGVIAVSSIDMMANSFNGQIDYEKYVSSNQSKNSISNRIASKIKEAAKAYYNSLYIAIPLDTYSYYLNAEQEVLAVLIPKFDSSGSIVQPSLNTTTFKAVAFSVIPKYMIDPGSQEYDSYVLVETNTEFDLAVSSSDPLTITQSLPTDWSAGKSQIMAENLKPAYFSNLNSTAFDVEGDMVNFAFVPKDGNVYFPSYMGSENINDGSYLTRCKLRNYRI